MSNPEAASEMTRSGTDVGSTTGVEVLEGPGQAPLAEVLGLARTHGAAR